MMYSTPKSTDAQHTYRSSENIATFRTFYSKFLKSLSENHFLTKINDPIEMEMLMLKETVVFTDTDAIGVYLVEPINDKSVKIINYSKEINEMVLGQRTFYGNTLGYRKEWEYNTWASIKVFDKDKVFERVLPLSQIEIETHPYMGREWKIVKIPRWLFNKQNKELYINALYPVHNFHTTRYAFNTVANTLSDDVYYISDIAADKNQNFTRFYKLMDFIYGTVGKYDPNPQQS